MSKILVVGSLGYDRISTPQGQVDQVLGGSANYFSLAASMYSEVNVVAVVGNDYKMEDKQMLTQRGVCTEGLQQVDGKTFFWEGRYEGDMNEAITVQTELNVFKDFNPALPENYRDSEFVFLANIDPILQQDVLKQVKSPKLVGVDTMNFWIQSKKQDLLKVLTQVDVLLINEGEARELTGQWNGIESAETLSALGPKAVVIKRGEYGFILYMQGEYFILPAFPIKKVVDPTGAGDTFAGGFFGFLSKLDNPLNLESLKLACVHGCLMASFTVQDFGVNPLVGLTWADIERRHADFLKVVSYH